MMKLIKFSNISKLGILFFILQLSSAVFSQKNTECGTIFNHRNAEHQLSQTIAKSSNPSVVIPVVVHVIYSNAAGNLTDAEVNQIINLLNLDFAKLNGHTSNIPAVWDTVATNTNIQFCLAQRDPSGAPTDGIDRRNTTVSQFNDQTSMKFDSTGGLNSWNPAKYFNIWICNYSSTGSHAFAVSPTYTINYTYGVVVDRSWVGTTYTTLTHEIGHCFGLDHIWGDDQPGCTSDHIHDTPPQQDYSPACLSYPWVDVCSPDTNGRMFMNFMDYGDCRSMFTNGQADKMHSVLSTSPYDLLTTSDGCTPVTLFSNDAGAFSILSPLGEICNTDVLHPKVVIRNWGTNPLTSVTITYQVGSSLPQTYSWTGNLPSLAYDTVLLPSIISNSGNQVISVSTSIPNGVTDQNINNDNTASTILVSLIGNNLPLVYGFEDSQFPPIDWALYEGNYLNLITRSTDASKSGIAALKVDLTYVQDEEVILTTPNLDLTNTSSPELSFELAYRMRYDTTTNYYDRLEVFISNDCGETWQSIYDKQAYGLATAPNIDPNDYLPNTGDWRLETIDLTAHASNANALFQFKFSSPWGGIVWLDDINISGTPLTIDEASSNAAFSIFPNPNSGVFQIQMSYEHSKNIKVEIVNTMGQTIFTEKKINVIDNHFNINLPTQPTGMYFLKLTDNDKMETVRFLID